MRIAVPVHGSCLSSDFFGGMFPKDDPNVEQKPEQLLTYHQDAKPILERYCTDVIQRRDRKLCADQLRKRQSSLRRSGRFSGVRRHAAVARATIRCLCAIRARWNLRTNSCCSIGSKAVRRKVMRLHLRGSSFNLRSDQRRRVQTWCSTWA